MNQTDFLSFWKLTFFAVQSVSETLHPPLKSQISKGQGVTIIIFEHLTVFSTFIGPW